MFWFQKSRTNWIQEGNRNTRFYHQSTIMRRNCARIRVLKFNGEWVSDPGAITKHISNYFINLFGRHQEEMYSEGLEWEGRCMDSNQASRLSRTATLDEVRKAVFGIKRWGSPGPDGIQAAFSQDYWDHVGVRVTNLVNVALILGKVPKPILEAYMTLIPKMP